MIPVRISEENYAHLQQMATLESRSATAQLNVILQERFGKTGGTPKNTVRESLEKAADDRKPLEKIAAEPTAPSGEVADLFNNGEMVPVVTKDGLIGKPLAEDVLEHPCCKNPNVPCKHWVWNSQSGEGYVNTLSGRMMEVE